ncbi:dihydroorotate dehydrogenase [Candidatus Woesearchaeota archaeon]|nr:dihydroorotate dehydrogenase [Candidatus Woesearchaeota archaeon]
MATLSQDYHGSVFSNPTVLAAGILGVSASSLANVIRNGAGAVTTKSVGPAARAGHPNPVVIATDGYLLNAVGLSNPGAEASVEELAAAVRGCSAPVIASVFGSTAQEFADVVRVLDAAKPAFFEANISCPNVGSEFGRPFGTDSAAAAKVVEEIKGETATPLIVKLSPNVPDLVEIAKAVCAAGADMLCAINTVGPGMLIDLAARRPVLANRSGGLSGPAIKPIAVRCVYDLYRAVDVPIIGTGGISTGKDAAEMIMAGASLVGIGSAVYYRGIDVFAKVARELDAFMQEHGYAGIGQLRGCAHDA